MRTPTLLVGLALVWTVACGGSDGGTGDADVDADVDADTDSDADSDSDTDPLRESRTIIVVTYPPLAVDPVPMEGATVAFDAPGGERVVATTGADGKVTFDGIDWSLGSAAVTAYLPGHYMRTITDVGPDTPEVGLLVDGAPALVLGALEPPTPPETVTISGATTGFVDPANNYVVNVLFSPVVSEWQGASGDTFSVQVPKGESATLQAIEGNFTSLPSGRGYDGDVHRVMHQTIEPCETDTVCDLDLVASEIPFQTAEAWLTLPTRADSPLREGNPLALVCPTNSSMCTGWAAPVDISADGSRFDVSWTWVEAEFAEKPYALFRVSNPTVGVYSQVNVPGYPEAGELPMLLDEPAWITQGSAGAPTNLHEPLEWDLRGQEIDMPTVFVVRNGVAVWSISSAAISAATLTVPQPPAGADAAALLGDGVLMVYMYMLDLGETGQVAAWVQSVPIYATR